MIDSVLLKLFHLRNPFLKVMKSFIYADLYEENVPQKTLHQQSLRVLSGSRRGGTSPPPLKIMYADHIEASITC